MTTPTTPEACREAQERVLKLLSESTPGPYRHDPLSDDGIWALDAQGREYQIARVAEYKCPPNTGVLLAAADDLARQNAALLAAHAEALERERIDLFSVDWATMPTETQDCLNWGRQAGGHFGPCGKCAACWLNQNMDALKELKEVNDKQRAEIVARDTIALVGTHGYAMNGPEEGELCEIRPTGEYRVLGSGEVRSIVDAPEGEVYFLSETPPAQAPASAKGGAK